MSLAQKHRDWTLDDLRKKLYPKAKDTDKKLAYLRTRATELLKHIETFLIQKSLENDPNLKIQCLVSELGRRQQKGVYLATFKKAIKTLEQVPLRTFSHHAAELALIEEYLRSSSYESHDRSQPLFQSAIDALDRAYATKKLSLACKAVSQDRDRGTLHRLPMMDDLKRWIESFDVTTEPILLIYYKVYLMISGGDDIAQALYYNAKAQIEAHWELLKQESFFELQEIVTYLINHCVLCINKGYQEFRGDLVELYDWALPRGILHTDGKISPANFRNAFFILSLGKDQAALERFVSGYGESVDGETEISMVQLCRGYNAFRRKDYEEAEAAFAHARTCLPPNADTRMEAEALAMLARVDYLRGEHREAMNRLKTLDRFLNRHRLPNNQGAEFKRFSLYLGKLIKAILSPKPQRAASSDEVIRLISLEMGKIFAKEWLKSESLAVAKKG